ncbi:hypothetical protein KR200_005719 [Drosophila serrata]|nr:hypothetical protein KR200_005719 [Drosophila serrata]
MELPREKEQLLDEEEEHHKKSTGCLGNPQEGQQEKKDQEGKLEETDPNRNGDGDLLGNNNKTQEDECVDKETEKTDEKQEEALEEDHRKPEEELTIQPLSADKCTSEDTPPVPPETQNGELTNKPTEDMDLRDILKENPEASEETLHEQEILEEKENQQKDTKLSLDNVFTEEDLSNEQVTHLQESNDEQETLKEKKNQQSAEQNNNKLGPNGEEDLPNEQVTQFLRHLIAKLWPELGSNPGLRLERASAKGDNYLGVVWRLQIDAAIANSESKCSLVVKLPPQNRVRRKQFFARPCFLRETAAYEEFLPLAGELQEKWQIPAEDRFQQHARCYGTRQDEPNECIVLEDLSCSGFELHNRFVDLPEDHVRHVIHSYAKLHALSLAGKRQCPERMKGLQEIVDIFEQRREDHALGVYFENLKRSALSSLTVNDESYRIRLEKYFSRGSYFELLLPLVSGSNCEPFAVICHGDCWNNNILYQRNGGDGELKDVRLIDWQLMRYASPITDLAYFLFTCTSRDFRQRHLNQVLKDYYEELGQHLIR